MYTLKYAPIHTDSISDESIYFAFRENTTEKNQNGSSHGNERPKQGVGLQIPLPASEPGMSLCVRKGVCLCRGSEGGSEEPALPTAGLGSFSSFSRVPASLCPLISRPFIAFVYYLLDFMKALRPGHIMSLELPVTLVLGLR